LMIINMINAFGSQALPAPTAGNSPPPYIDVVANNVIAPNDALAVINVINGGKISDIPGSASFVGFDTVTQGNWQTKYGADGYALASHITSMPTYAHMTITGGLTDAYDFIDSFSTNDPRALQKPGSTDRLAAEWVGDYAFTLDVNIEDGQTHQVAIYVLSGEAARYERTDVIDATTGNLLDTQTFDSSQGSKYVVWNISGHVQIRFTNTANGLGAVASGVFFD